MRLRIRKKKFLSIFWNLIISKRSSPKIIVAIPLFQHLQVRNRNQQEPQVWIGHNTITDSRGHKSQATWASRVRSRDINIWFDLTSTNFSKVCATLVSYRICLSYLQTYETHADCHQTTLTGEGTIEPLICGHSLNLVVKTGGLTKQGNHWTITSHDRTWRAVVHGDCYVTFTVYLHQTPVYPTPGTRPVTQWSLWTVAQQVRSTKQGRIWQMVVSANESFYCINDNRRVILRTYILY